VFASRLRRGWNGDRPRGRYALSATRRAIIAARLEPPVHAILVEHMPTREQPQILLWIIVLQTDEAPVHAHGRDPPSLLVLGERAHTYHLETRIVNVLPGYRLRLRLPKQLRELLE